MYDGLDLARGGVDTLALRSPVIYGFLCGIISLGSRLYQVARSMEKTCQDLGTCDRDIGWIDAGRLSRRGRPFLLWRKPLAALEPLSNVIESGMTDEERAEALKFDVVDIKVAVLGYTSWAHWQLGHADKARRVSDEAMTTAKQTGHPFSMAFAICFASWTRAFCGELQRALELSEEAYALSKRHGFEFWIGWTEVISAWSRAHLNKAYDTELEKLSVGIADWKDTRSRLGLSYFLYLQADFAGGKWRA